MIPKIIEVLGVFGLDPETDYETVAKDDKKYNPNEKHPDIRYAILENVSSILSQK